MRSSSENSTTPSREQSPKQDSASYTQDPSYLGISALKTAQTKNIEATSFTSMNAKIRDVTTATSAKLLEELLFVRMTILERIRTHTSSSTLAQRNILARRKPTSKCWPQTTQTVGKGNLQKQCSSGTKSRRSTFKKTRTNSYYLDDRDYLTSDGETTPYNRIYRSVDSTDITHCSQWQAEGC